MSASTWVPGSTVCGAKGGLRSLPVTEVAGKSDRFMLRRGVAWRPTFAGVVVAVDDDSPPRKLEPVALAFLIELLDEAGSKGVAFDQLKSRMVRKSLAEHPRQVAVDLHRRHPAGAGQ